MQDLCATHNHKTQLEREKNVMGNKTGRGNNTELIKENPNDEGEKI